MRPYQKVATGAAAVVLSLAGLTAVLPRLTGNDDPAPPVAEPFVADAPAATGAEESSTDVTTGTRTREARRNGPLGAIDAIAELRASARPPAIHVDRTGHLRSVAAPTGGALRRTPGTASTSDPAAAAGAFVNRYGQAFGLRPGQQARRHRIDALPGGDRVVRFGQHVGGVRVLGGDLVVTVNRAGEVVSAVAETPVGTPTATRATVSAATAGLTGRAAAADKLGVRPADLAVGETTLWLYDPRLLGAPGRAQLRPTWMVRLKRGAESIPAATALVDATDGTVSLVFSEVKFARNRLICDLNNAAVNLGNPATYRCDTVAGGPAVARSEGGAASAVADVNTAYDFLGDTYDFFQRRVGRDSIDGRGMQMRATVRACYSLDVPPCPFENAFWDGAQMVFGTGFAADDVVGHELTHGVTDFTSQLFYAFQSGAINEAFSDIMGEFIDQTNGQGTDTAGTKWQIGEDLPASVGVIRDMEDPTAPIGGGVCDDPDNDEFPPGCQPDRVGSPLYTHDPFFLDDGGVHINSGIANKAAYLLAEPGTKTFNGQNVTGIGLDKSVHLWYRVMLGITSGGDYEDLGNLLALTCRRLAGNLGFTLADCVEVDDAVRATEMINTLADGTIEADLCPSGGQPINAIFSDDMERGSTKWVRTAGAQIIPSSQVPLRWAHSGIRAMYLPPTASMTMTNFVAIPASGTTYLWFAHNPFTGLPRLALNNGTTTTQVTFGSNWNLPGGSRTGWVPSELSTGYVSTRFQLSSFAGQNLKVSFVEDPVIVDGEAFGEWLVDDVLIYQCANRVGTVGNLAGPRDASRTAADLSWTAPPFSGPGLAGYEISVKPSLPGYPVTLPAGALSHTITGLNPNRRYSVSVRAIGTDAVMGAPAVLPLDLIRACYVLHVPDNPLWTCPFVPRKPTPFG